MQKWRAHFFRTRHPTLMNHLPHTAAPYQENPMHSARRSLVWGWCLVGGAFVLAIVPFIGVFAWFIGPPLILAGFVLSIIAMSKGRTGGGVVLLLFSIIVAPVTIIFAPVIASVIGMAAAASEVVKPVPENSGVEPGSPESGNRF